LFRDVCSRQMLDFYGIDFNKGHLKLAKHYEDRCEYESHLTPSQVSLPAGPGS